MSNLASRKTVNGLELFNNLVKAGLVRFLNQKEEKAKTIEVSATELSKARKEAEKALAVRGPVDEPCDPYEWDDEYDEDIDF